MDGLGGWVSSSQRLFCLFGLSLLRSTLRFLPGQLPAFTSGVKQWEDPGGVRVFPILWEMGFPLLRA